MVVEDKPKSAGISKPTSAWRSGRWEVVGAGKLDTMVVASRSAGCKCVEEVGGEDGDRSKQELEVD